MSGAIHPLPQHAFMALCFVKALTLPFTCGLDLSGSGYGQVANCCGRLTIKGLELLDWLRLLASREGLFSMDIVITFSLPTSYPKSTGDCFPRTKVKSAGT